MVYQARSLYQLLSGLSPDYDDEDCATGNGSNQRLTQNGQLDGGQAYSLYPNPNEGNFVLKQINAEQKTVNLKVYNALGALVYQSQAEFVHGTAKVNMGQRAQGMYLVCIGDADARTVCLRFTIK